MRSDRLVSTSDNQAKTKIQNVPNQAITGSCPLLPIYSLTVSNQEKYRPKSGYDCEIYDI